MRRSARTAAEVRRSVLCRGRALRSLGTRTVAGRALVSSQPLTFLGFLDRRTGAVGQPGHPLDGATVGATVLVFPRGIGSTVGPYVLLEMAENGVAPAALVMQRGDLGTIAAASLARIPLIYDAEPDPTRMFSTGERLEVRVRGGSGTVARARRR